MVMRNLLQTIPNRITAGRLLLVPVMWLLAWLQLPVYLGIGTFVSFITDVLDGYIARRFGMVSDMGSQFDSVADNILLPSVLAWLWLFRPEIFRDHLAICSIAVALYFSTILLGMVKFARFANLHLYSSKIAAVPMYVFASHALIAAHYSPTLFYLAVGCQVVSSGETLLLQAISPKVDEHMGSLLRLLHRRDSG
jgi:CDP-diacylglycerol--glycerol-3-phosphate 3-phosphatidyltransferase